MRTTLTKAALTVGLLGVVQSAEAQQSSARVTGDVTQTFTVRDNNNLTGSGIDFRSLTGLGFRLASTTQTSNVSATSGIALRLTKNGFSLTRPKLTLGFGKNTKNSTYTGRLSYAKAPVAVDELQPDLSVLRLDADRTTIGANLEARTTLNATTSVRFGLNATRVDFDPSSASLVGSTNVGMSGQLNYRLNQRTSYGVNGRLGYFEGDGATNTTSLSADLGGQLKHELDSTSTFDGNLGVSFIDTTDTVSSVTTSAFSVSLLFGAGLTRDLADGSVGVSLNQSVNPSATGSLALGTRLSGSFTKNVNQNESYGINASLGRQEDIGGGTVTTFINVSPSYTRQLTRDVEATASYYLQRDDTGSTAQGVTVSFTRPFDFPLR